VVDEDVWMNRGWADTQYRERLHHLRVINLTTLDPSWLAISANRQFTYLKESCHLEISRVLRLFCTEKHYKLGHSTVASSCSNLVRLCQFPCQLLQTHHQFIWPLFRVQSRGKTSSAWKVKCLKCWKHVKIVD